MNLKTSTVNPLIFRAYDIRGIAGQDLTEESMYIIGLATGTYFIRKGLKEVAVGRDNRLSGEKLQHAFIQGLLKTGGSVTNIGLAFSPLIYYATCALAFDAGINITASHNPKEYNGIKIVSKNAHSIAGEELQEICKLAETENFETGNGIYKEDTSIFEHYLEFIKNNHQLSRPVSVVIDSGNGITGMFAPTLLRSLGATVHELYCELDGNFPNHEANPELEKNMTDLKKTAVEKKAHIGIGFDGDGDRIGVVDHTGKFYSADLLLILLSRDVLSRHPGAKIVFDVKCSRLLEDDIRKHKGIPIMSKSGHTFMEAKIKQQKALLGGEASGHMFFAENFFGYDDALFAAARTLKILDEQNSNLKNLLSDLPSLYTSPEIKASCPDHRKFEVMSEIVDFFKKRYPSITIDGIRMNFNDTDWALIRCSNTGPHLTMRFEAQTSEGIETMKKIVFEKLKEYKEVNI